MLRHTGNPRQEWLVGSQSFVSRRKWHQPGSPDLLAARRAAFAAGLAMARLNAHCDQARCWGNHAPRAIDDAGQTGSKQMPARISRPCPCGLCATLIVKIPSPKPDVAEPNSLDNGPAKAFK
jgi:hypothetical protein